MLWKPTLNEKNRQELLKKIVKRGEEMETGETHGLSRDQLQTVFATADFFSNSEYMEQVVFYLGVARCRLCDWIATLLSGGDDGNARLAQVMTSAYLRCNDIGGFIRNLRTRDYQIGEPILEPISRGDGKVELTLRDKKALVGHARGNPEVKNGYFHSEVYGRELPVSAVKGLCPSCGEPICDDEKARTMDQMATEKDNYCGYDGFEADDDELVKRIEEE